MSNQRKGIVSISLLAAAFLLLAAAEISPGFTQWYGDYIYPVLVNTVGRIYGVIPYSGAELWIYIGIIMLLFLLIRFIIRRCKKEVSVKKAILTAVINGCMAAAILFLIFTIACGINYKRTSFAKRNEIVTGTYTKEDLKELCQILTNAVNKVSSKVTRNASQIAVLEGKEGSKAAESMKKLGEEYKELAGYYPSPKKLLFPQILSYQSLSGIYSPFTLEATYNNDMIPYNIPFTQCHELSHLKGIMQEEEANFVAYLACKESGDPFFEYSGYMLAWLYSTNVLYTVDPDGYEEIRTQLSNEAEKDLAQNDAFWNDYEGPVSEAADKVNDTYLKANGQDDGVKSYDRMVDMLVAYEVLSKKD